MRKSLLRAVVPSIAVLALMSVSQPAFAHESRTVGAYETVVGWANEPVFTGFPNAVQFILSDAAGNPVVDLGPEDLKVEVSYGDQKVGPLPVEPAFRVGSFGEPGDYQSDLIPSRPGEYSFHFTGTIKGQQFDETYTSGEETFGTPENPSTIEFPAKDPTNGELAESIGRLESKIDDSRGGNTVGMIGAGLGAVALIVALIALLRRKPA
jgi:hypothetical protein